MGQSIIDSFIGQLFAVATAVCTQVVNLLNELSALLLGFIHCSGIAYTDRGFCNWNEN